MREINKYIQESFYKNTGTNITGFWQKVNVLPHNNQFWGEVWDKMYKVSVEKGKLILEINPVENYSPHQRKSRAEIDIASSEMLIRLMKVFKPTDLNILFEPSTGMTHLYIFSKNRSFSAHITLHSSTSLSSIYLFNMKGLELLDWTEEYFHSHGWCTGSETGIQNQEFIKEFINYKKIY